jgi:hypothetical protein
VGFLVQIFIQFAALQPRLNVQIDTANANRMETAQSREYARSGQR